jgi:DNA-directed RNA polymerase subunit omega
MNKPPLDTLMDKVDSKYTLIAIGAKRARQITENRPELLEGGTVNPVSVALKEISQGKIKWERVKTLPKE